ncbi:hypothetical protein D3C80_1216680 [compost metagenome]
MFAEKVSFEVLEGVFAVPYLIHSDPLLVAMIVLFPSCSGTSCGEESFPSLL